MIGRSPPRRLSRALVERYRQLGFDALLTVFATRGLPSYSRRLAPFIVVHRGANFTCVCAYNIDVKSAVFREKATAMGHSKRSGVLSLISAKSNDDVGGCQGRWPSPFSTGEAGLTGAIPSSVESCGSTCSSHHCCGCMLV